MTIASDHPVLTVFSGGGDRETEVVVTNPETGHQRHFRFDAKCREDEAIAAAVAMICVTCLRQMLDRG